MVFEKKGLVFLGVKNVKSKSGKDISFIRLADPITYSNVDFFKSNDCTVDGINAGDKVNAFLKFEDKFSSVSIVKVS